MQVESPLLTVEQTMEYLGLPKDTVYEFCRCEGFPAVKLGRHWKIYKVELDKWLQEKLKNKEACIPRLPSAF
jgi:excisionase family DNA binding protein